MPTFRQCATGIVVSGSAWWLGLDTVGTEQSAAPVFDPPGQVQVIDSFNQDRTGQDYWRWAGSLTGDRTVVRLSRGDCFDAYLPGNFNGPTMTVSSWAPGDWDFDGQLNSSDISAFLSSWVGSVGSPDPTGDYNLDGIVNSSDISAFLAAWLGN